MEGTCVNEHALAFTGAGLSIAADLVIMFLPVYELKGLNLTLRKRVALTGMFALGSLYVYRFTSACLLVSGKLGV